MSSHIVDGFVIWFKFSCFYAFVWGFNRTIKSSINALRQGSLEVSTLDLALMVSGGHWSITTTGLVDCFGNICLCMHTHIPHVHLYILRMKFYLDFSMHTFCLFDDQLLRNRVKERTELMDCSEGLLLTDLQNFCGMVLYGARICSTNPNFSGSRSTSSHVSKEDLPLDFYYWFCYACYCC